MKNYFYKSKNSFLCTPIDIVYLFFFIFASCVFSEKCDLGGVLGCGVGWCDMVRPPRLVSYACLYTTNSAFLMLQNEPILTNLLTFREFLKLCFRNQLHT